jgi:hypothetical protein
MTVQARFSLLALVAALLLGCSPPPPQDKEEAEALGRDTDKTVFDDMIQTEDRARAVEGTLMQEKKNTDAQIDSMTGAAPDADPSQ